MARSNSNGLTEKEQSELFAVTGRRARKHIVRKIVDGKTTKVAEKWLIEMRLDFITFIICTDLHKKESNLRKKKDYGSHKLASFAQIMFAIASIIRSITAFLK
jgi:hypothetical protein